MKIRHSSVLLASLLLGSAAFAEDTTATWIGGSSGAALAASNWGLSAIEDCQGLFRITNSVTFTESGSKLFWYVSSLTIENRSTVRFDARYWPGSSSTPVMDIGDGSSVNITYLLGGQKAKSFYRRGLGTLTTATVGSGGNVWKNAYFENGLSKVGYFCVNDLIDISPAATVRLTGTRGVDSGTPAWNVDGKLDCNAITIPAIAGLSGSGLVTNANNLTVNLLKPNLTFNGALQGRLVVEPATNAVADAYMVIGNAQTLANAELVITDVEGHGDPIRFAAGIGTFYARKFDRNRVFRDTEGNPVTLVESQKHLYVDAARPDDSGDGLSWATAYQSLKAAVESPSLDPLGTIIHVAEGQYTKGVMGADSGAFRVILPANVELRSRDGAEKTFIVGAASPTPTSYGCGPGAIRCVKLEKTSRIEGFTITGGRVTDYNSVNGGGCSGTGTFVDCVLSNNVASQGGAVVCGPENDPTTFIRCRFLENRSRALGSALFYSVVAYDCLFDNNINHETIYTGAGQVMLYNCTFGPNDTSMAVRTYGQNKLLSHAYNCVFLKGVRGNNNSQTNLWMHSCVATVPPSNGAFADDSCTVTNLTSTEEALAFVGLDAELKPLLSGQGRTVDAGTNGVRKLPAFENGNWDLNKDTRVRGAGIDVGAIEFDPTRTWVVVSVPEGGVDVTGVGLGTTEIAKGSSVTVTLRRNFTSEKLCKGLVVNGEYVDFDDCAGVWTKTVEGVGVSAYLNISAVYSTEKVLYVDGGAKGDDANKGYHPDCPRKTLAGAMTPTPASGTVVKVAPGWYTNETMAGGSTTRARVVVPAGVTLESLEGAEKTFIVGEPSPTPEAAAWSKCGPDAVRCVELSSGAVLRGFTCTNGYTICTSKDGDSGGGVYGGTVEDCVITRCEAWRGGGAHGSICRRCRFVDNAAVQIGAHVNESYGVYDCVFTKTTRGGAHITLNVAPLVNCTFFGNGTGAAWPAAHYSNTTHWPSTPSNLVNCVIFGSAENMPYYTSCVFDTYASNVTEENRGAGSVMLSGRGVDLHVLDDEGRPFAGTCVVDAGTNTAFAATCYGTLDAGRGQRIYNGRVDIGAYEYDWRGDFARALATSRRLEVLTAGANVTTNAAGGVTLTDGEALTARWTNPRDAMRDYTAVVSVTGTGTLTCTCGGIERTVTAADGIVTIAWSNALAENDLAFAFAGDGEAVVSKTTSRGTLGLLLLVR